MSWVDRHGWVPFLRGTDGLTGRQRARLAARYAATVGKPSGLIPSNQGSNA